VKRIHISTDAPAHAAGDEIKSLFVEHKDPSVTYIYKQPRGVHQFS